MSDVGTTIEDVTGVPRAMLISALIRLRPQIVEWRDRAVISCFLDPVGWLLMNPEPIADYLARLDRLDAICALAEAEKAGQQ